MSVETEAAGSPTRADTARLTVASHEGGSSETASLAPVSCIGVHDEVHALCPAWSRVVCDAGR